MMKLFHACGSTQWERVMRRGFVGDMPITFTKEPDARGLWLWRGEEPASIAIEIPEELAEAFRDGAVYRIPPARANQYLPKEDQMPSTAERME